MRQVIGYCFVALLFTGCGPATNSSRGGGGGTSGGDGGGGCTAGDMRCTGDVQEVCANNVWTAGEDCAGSDLICVSTSTTTAECQACVAGMRRCSNDQIQICAAANWTTEQDCGAVEDTCNLVDDTTAVCVTPPCTDGTQRCAGSELQLCTGGVWGLDQDCAQSSAVCEPSGVGTAACVVQQCVNDGDEQCNGDVIETCTAGSWVMQEDCSLSSMSCMTNGFSYVCTAPGAGACANPADQTIIGDSNMRTEAVNCVSGGCFASPFAPCVSACLVTGGLSQPCADCYGQMVDCAAANCSMCISAPDSAECVDCLDAYCMPDFSTCSGV